VNLVHNAQVCYFNNVWLMFLIFKKKISFQTTVDPPPPPWSFAFPTLVVYPVNPPSHFPLRLFTLSTPPYLVLRISHSDSLIRQSPRPVPHISHSGSLTRRSPRPILHIAHSSPLVLAHLHSESAVTVLPTTLNSREHKKLLS
jgi:hypothetical protein